jgi:hypothetical protein
MRVQKSYLWVLPLALFLAGLVGMGLVASTSVPPAAAQDARVMISPATSTLSVDDVVTVEVYIENVQSLWAGQVALSFDPAVVQVVDETGNPATQIQRGDLLNPARVTEYVNAVDNAAGIIEYAATLRNDPRHPTSPASGSGSFARIFFKAVGAGTSPVAFSTADTTYIHEIKFVDGDLEEFTLPLEDGSLTVGAGQAIYLPLIMRNHPVASDSDVHTEGIAAGPGRVRPDALRNVITAGRGPTAPLDDPDLIVHSPTPLDVAVVGDDIYWTHGGAEFCDADDPSSTAGIVHYNLATSNFAVLWSGCDIGVGPLVADDSYVYFTDSTARTIRKIPVGGGDISTIAATSTLFFFDALAADSSHIYFADAGGVKRVSKTGGTVETLAAGYHARRLAVDDDYVYWTERGVSDAIRRVPKGGGVIDDLLLDEDTNDPFDITLDDTHIYWTERGGLARRMPKAGGASDVQNYGVAGTWLAGDIVVDDTHVYWVDELRLRRAPKVGGPVEALALDLVGPRGLNVTETLIVWGGGGWPAGGIWGLPLGASEELVDLSIAGIEITQAIQNMDNDAPLIEGKTTYVRVYPVADRTYTRDVTARLHGTQDGSILLRNVNPIAPVGVGARGANRAVFDQSLNFLLPEYYTHGTVEFEVEINPDREIPESNYANNRLSITRTFTPSDDLCVRMVPVWTELGTPFNYSYRYGDIIDWFTAAYPIPDVSVLWDSGRLSEYGEPVHLNLGPDGVIAADDEDEVYRFLDVVLVLLNRLNMLYMDNPGCAENSTHFYGMIHPDVFEPYFSSGAGKGYKPGREAAGTMHTDLGWIRDLWASYFNYGDWYWYSSGAEMMAHEIGHNLDRAHVDCGWPRPTGNDPAYPYDPCDIGPDDPEGFFGFNSMYLAAIPPTAAGDIMSYADHGNLVAPGTVDVGKPQWVSDYTYENLYEAINGSSSRGQTAASATLAEAVTQAEESLMAGGLVSQTSDTAELLSVMRLPEGLVSAGKLAYFASRIQTGPMAEYTLQLLDGANTVLRDLRFDPPDTMDSPGDTQPFFLVMPYDPNTARLVLFRGSTELARRDVSSSPPGVTVLQPNGGEDITDHMKIEWQADDPDGDVLEYTVQYSSDGGTTWAVLELSTRSTTLDLDDLSLIPGSSQALVRVIANDGVNTTTDTSDAPFSVARKSPIADISQPVDGAVYPSGVQVIAMGRGYDGEDGTLSGEALDWFVDDTPAGSGRDIALSDLTPGAHTVTLRVADSDQMTGEAQITIHVEPPQCEAFGKVDVLFLLDTSPDMTQHLDNACRTISEVVETFRSQGLEVRYETLGISQATGCAKNSVRDRLPSSSVNHPADWGAAVRDMAAQHSWSEGAARLIVPITNQGPEDGNPVEDPGADRDVIYAATVAAQRSHVTVAPLLMPSDDQEAAPAVRRLAESLAAATGGQVFEWGRDDQIMAADLMRVVPAVACGPSIDGVSPACGFDAEATLTLFGENLAPGTQVYVGDLAARDVTPNGDGTQITFKIPAGLQSGRTYDVRVERPGVGSDTLSGGLTNGPCLDRCDDFQSGDIQLPMWNLRGDQAEIMFQALAAGEELTVRLYADNGPMKLLVQEGDGTGITSIGVLAGTTGEISVPTTAGKTYLVLARNAQGDSARFRLLVRGAEYLRTADDGDDWSGGMNSGRGEDHGAMSHPALGEAERWRELGPEFATTTWYFNVESGADELAVRVWGENVGGDGHAGMEWIRPSGIVQPLVGPEGPNFDHTWQVRNPEAGFWGLRIKAGRFSSPLAYSLARVDQSSDDWLYFRSGSMVGPPCGPSLLLVPPEASFCTDDVFRMDIVVSDVANLYGAEVYLTFDPTMLEVVDASGDPTFEIEPGPFLDPALGLVGLNSADNVGGFIDYAVSLRDPAPPAFGTGVLATVYFRPKATGTTTVQFDQVKLSEKPVPPAPGKPILAEFRDATFEVNECFAPGQEAGAMSGQVWLDGRLNHSGAEVGAEPGGHLVLTLPDGSFEMAALPAGGYTVDVQKTSYLRAGERSFTVAGGGSLALPNVTLLGGDCNNDDGIDITDGAIASASFGFGTGQASFDVRADINGDGLVDIFDLVMVGNNFGCSVTDATARCQRWGRP